MVSSNVALGLAAATLGISAALGVWWTRGRVRTVEDFITARDSAGRGVLTASLVASVMGVWILFSVPEAGAAFGGLAAVLGYAVGEALPMIAYATLGPRIRDLIPEGHSLTEYALARYGPAMYGFVLLVSLGYMFIFLAAELTGITSALHLVAGVPEWQTAVLIGGVVLLYTAYGGLHASLFTDTVQTLLILPLLAASAVGAVLALGGVEAVHAQVVAADPSLLDPTFRTGLRFGVWVGIAILGAELVNQTWWQRVYAAEDGETLEGGFRTAAVANMAVVLLAGLFGVVARGVVDLTTNPAASGYDASIAFFVLLQEAFPETVVLAVVLLALLLVMSSADTMFNAIASLVTADLPRLLDDPTDRTLTLGARALTVLVAAGAIVVSLRAQSVLRVFLLADLLGAAVAFPLLYGLYSRRASQTAVLAASVLGLAVGLAWFPNQLVRGGLQALGLGPWLPAGDFLYAFVGAAGVSVALTLVLTRLLPADHDLGRLSTEIRRIDAEAPGEVPDEEVGP